MNDGQPYEPQLGDIGLTSISGWSGRGIRLGQWIIGDGFSRYEHAFVHAGRMPDEDEQMIVEAEPGGALLSPLSRYAPETVYWLRCPGRCASSVAVAARRMVGTPYSWADYASLGAHRFHVPVPGLRGYIESSGHMICSQLADRAALDGGWHLFADGRWEGDVTPGDLWKLGGDQLRSRTDQGRTE